LRNPNAEWNALRVCEIVLGAIGCVFSLTGAIIWYCMDDITASPGSRGDVRILPWVFLATGLTFLIVSVVLMYSSARRRRRRLELIESGMCINALVTEVLPDLSVRVNGRHPHYIMCKADDAYIGKNLTFKGPNSLRDLSGMTGQYVKVYIDRREPENYYVDMGM